MIALTMEKWDLHKRLALLTIRTIGGGPSRIILGFMVASAFLSAWMSNTATTIMMLPIGLSIILQMEEEFGEKDTHKFSLCLMLGIGCAASMGGMATLVGTPRNLVLQRTFQLTFPKAPPHLFWNLDDHGGSFVGVHDTYHMGCAYETHLSAAGTPEGRPEDCGSR